MGAEWERLRASSDLFDSPFLSYEFFTIANRVRPNLFVALQRAGEVITAVCAYESHGNAAYPIGRMFNDAHGPILNPETTFDWRSFFREAQVSSFHFHSMREYSSLDPQIHVFDRVKTFHCDLSIARDGYLTWLNSNHRTVSKQHQKTRKLAREIGTLRFEFDCSDSAVLDQIIQLKSDQYRRTNLFDKFSLDWIRELLHRLHQSTSSVRGQLSVLWAGEKLVAGHYGLREGKLLHYWFPVYDLDYSRYSPGTALFVDVVKSCEMASVEKIDFGYGELAYKWKLCNVVSHTLEGVVTCSPATRVRSELAFHSKKFLKQLPVKDTLKSTVRRLFPSVGATDHGSQ